MVIRQSLRVRKQELVHDAIFDAAIELFAAKGFDETTVEEVAQAEGVSRRSFFRYFASKDDLLAQNVVQYGIDLTSAIQECAPSLTPLEIVRQTVLSIAKKSVAHPRTRQVIEISERSASARQAHLSRMMDVEDRMAASFAARLNSSSKNAMQPRLLAGLTLSVMNIAMIAWYTGEYQDVSIAAEQALSDLTRMFCDPASAIKLDDRVAPQQRKASAANRRKHIR